MLHSLQDTKYNPLLLLLLPLLQPSRMKFKQQQQQQQQKLTRFSSTKER